MSTTFDRGDVVIECDGKGCHESSSEDRSNFSELWTCLKALGWKAHKSGESWFHYCPDCQKDDLTSLTKGLK